jgi:hypothetical protein
VDEAKAGRINKKGQREDKKKKHKNKNQETQKIDANLPTKNSLPLAGLHDVDKRP